MIDLSSLGFVVAIATYASARLHSTNQTNQQTATCTTTAYQWAFNSLGQSPCEVAARVAGACYGGSFDVPTLATGDVYWGPYAGEDNACTCSSVYYSLISACSLCQSVSDYLRWSAFNTNCSAIYPGRFPPGVPAGTRVPHWAYLDVTTNDRFLPSDAESALNAPESTYISAASSVTSTVTISASATSALATSSAARSSNAGLIAGSAIGGFIGLALIAGLVFLWMRQRHCRNPQLDPLRSSMTEPLINSTRSHISPFLDSPPMELYHSSNPNTPPVSNPSQTTSVYNGDSLPTYSTLDLSNPNQPSGTLYATKGLRYTGAPEIS